MLQPYYIYLRVFGYLVTLVVYVSNIVVMTLRMNAQELEEVLQDPTLKLFKDCQTRYLTCWTFALLIVHAVMALICDYLTLKNSGRKDYKPPKKLSQHRHALFAAIIWPSVLLVSGVFWSIYHIDRELVYPKVYDKLLTWVSNHIVHTLIVPVALWEVIFRARSEPRPSTHLWNFTRIMIHFVLYLCVFFYTYYEQGMWLYPVFGKIYGTIYLPIFLFLTFLLLLGCYYIQWPITRFIHGTKVQSKTHES